VRKNSATDFTLLVASAQILPDIVHTIDVSGKKAKLTIQYGDFSASLKKVNLALQEVSATHINSSLHNFAPQAKKFAANENQVAMIEGYIKS
jgi:dipeptidyl-peptidase-3